jgi:hypothetical protein
MNDIFSGFTEQELIKMMTHTDTALNDLIRERLGLPKNKNNDKKSS